VLSSTSRRWLLLLPFAWVACDANEIINPVGADAGQTTSSSSSSSSATSSSSSSTTSSSSSSSTTSSSSGTGGAATSSSSGSGGGASSSSTSGTGGSGGSTTSSSSSSSGTGGSGGGSTTSSSSSSSSSSGGITGTRVRITAANLSSGNNQSYDPGHGIRILQGVHADVILMQEMNYGDNSTAKIRELVDAVCGTQCAYTRGSGQIPNGVVSRFPIVESGTWTDPKVSNRDFCWARIDVPGPVDLWAVSVHLLTSNPTDRAAEATALVADLQGKVPAGDHIVVGGDFNTSIRDEPALMNFGALFSVAAPYPVDGNGNGNTSAPRTKPYDWVLPTPGLRARETPVVIGAAHFDTGLVVDTRVYTPIADLAPALTSDSGAPSMQHMAVVRDFLLE
jgi:endonuclease/exonuclease/phosphatase family metal-dependent hydrolase